MSRRVTETTTLLTRGSGEQREEETLPTTILSSDEAAILAHYRSFLDSHELLESIYCDECIGPPDQGAKIVRSQTQLTVFCRHHVWFYQGNLPAPSTLDLTLGPIVPVGRAERITITDSTSQHEEVKLGESSAKLLRAYDRLLTKFGWKETLDCRICWANSRPEGLRAFVTPDRIGLICRHRTLAYVGQTN